MLDHCVIEILLFPLAYETNATPRGKQYKINITRSGNNLSFNTAIKRTPAAQGGQAPIDMVVALLDGGVKFSKEKEKYPMKDLTHNRNSEYETMYNFVSKKHFPFPALPRQY